MIYGLELELPKFYKNKNHLIWNRDLSLSKNLLSLYLIWNQTLRSLTSDSTEQIQFGKTASSKP